MLSRKQENQIRRLREENIGYRTIAAQLGISRDTVRNFCTANQLSGLRAAKDFKPPEKCLYCGAELIQPVRGRRRKFCSDSCCRSWWAENPQAHQQYAKSFYRTVCMNCGKEFMPYGNDHRRYCSHACYIRHRFGNRACGEEKKHDSLDFQPLQSDVSLNC